MMSHKYVLQANESSVVPTKIKIAVSLIVVSMLASILLALFDKNVQEVPEVLKYTFIALSITAIIMVILGRGIWLGKNWARLTYLILLCAVVVAALDSMPRYVEYSAPEATLKLIQILAQFGVVILTYLPTSRAWFDSTRSKEKGITK